MRHAIQISFLFWALVIGLALMPHMAGEMIIIIAVAIVTALELYHET